MVGWLRDELENRFSTSLIQAKYGLDLESEKAVRKEMRLTGVVEQVHIKVKQQSLKKKKSWEHADAQQIHSQSIEDILWTSDTL